MDRAQNTLPRNRCLGISNILSWRNLRNSRCGKNLLASPEAGRRLSCERCLICTPGKTILISKVPRGIWINKPCCFPQFAILSSNPFLSNSILSQFSTHHQTWHKNTQVQRFPQVFISLWKLLCPVQCILNKLICFSFVILFLLQSPHLDG